MNQQVKERPKTYREYLEELDLMEVLDITDKNRQMFANTMTMLHHLTDKRFKIITSKDGKTVSVWRME